MIKDLVFDRTKKDVDEVDKDSRTLCKGAYSYVDLSRVEWWCQFLKDRAEILGYPIDGLVIRKGTTMYQDLYAFEYEQISQEFTYKELLHFFCWHMSDIPSLEEINRIRNNINILRNFFLENSELIIEFSKDFDFEKANILEKLLYELDLRIAHIYKQTRFCGTFSCGESSVIFC